MSLRAAKTLFFEYEGSLFYMSRNGVDDQYRSYGVTKSQEAAWLKELTTIQLERLSEPGNWRVINFLWHRELCDHLDEVLEAVPLGKLWERCAFLEDVIDYYELCRKRRPRHVPPEKCREYLLAHSALLKRRCRSAASLERVEAIASAALKRI